MSVVKIHKDKNYTVMCNEHLRDKTMSLKAKGLLSVVLSLPDEWEYSVNGLVSICKESKHTVESTLKELQEFGYLEVEKLLPNQTDSGRFEYVYNFYEKRKQEPKKQGVEIQGVEIQGVENCPQLNTNKSNTKELNKDIKENIKETQIFQSTTEDGEQVLEVPMESDLFFKENAKDLMESQITETIDYLNQKTGKKFRTKVEANRKLIRGRLSDGYTLEDLKQVVDVKCDEWGDNPEFAKNLNPTTLFRPSNFDRYLNQSPKPSAYPDWYKDTETHPIDKDLLARLQAMQREMKE